MPTDAQDREREEQNGFLRKRHKLCRKIATSIESIGDSGNAVDLLDAYVQEIVEAARREERKRTDEAIRLAHVFRGKVPFVDGKD